MTGLMAASEPIINPPITPTGEAGEQALAEAGNAEAAAAGGPSPQSPPARVAGQWLGQGPRALAEDCLAGGVAEALLRSSVGWA